MTQHDFDFAIEKNRIALVQIVVTLFALLGFAADDAPAKISRRLKSKIYAMLRPAESATRRLIYTFMKLRKISCQTLTVKTTQRARSTALHSSSKIDAIKPSAQKPPPFKLFDLGKNFERTPQSDITKNPPHIRFFHIANQVFNTPPDPVEHSETTSSNPVIARIKSLESALKNLPGEAVRMAREIQKRKAAPEKITFTRLPTPLRPGAPPGYTSKPRHQSHVTLKESMWLVHEVDNHPPWVREND